MRGLLLVNVLAERRWNRRRMYWRFCCPTQCKRKLTPFVYAFALAPDMSPHAFDQPFTDSQPQTYASPGGSAPLIKDLKKAVKDLFRMFRRQSIALVRNPYLQRISPCAGAYFNRFPGGRVFNSVFDQIDDQLGHSIRVCQHVLEFTLNIQIDGLCRKQGM